MKNSRNYYVKSLLNRDITNLRGEDLGLVEDAVVNPEGNIEFLVVSYGGILGTTWADKRFAIPYSQFGWNEQDDTLTLNIDRSVLENAPGFNKDDEIPTLAGSDYFSTVRQHYTDYLEVA